MGNVSTQARHTEAAKMPAFKVSLSDGNHFVTSMAVGVTLTAARQYLIGARHYYTIDETRFADIVDVSIAE